MKIANINENIIILLSIQKVSNKYRLNLLDEAKNLLAYKTLEYYYTRVVKYQTMKTIYYKVEICYKYDYDCLGFCTYVTIFTISTKCDLQITILNICIFFFCIFFYNF